MAFRQDELKRLSELAISKWPSQADRKHPYVLAPGLATENLHSDVRGSALAYFEKYVISWWLSKEERNERKLALGHVLLLGVGRRLLLRVPPGPLMTTPSCPTAPPAGKRSTNC